MNKKEQVAFDALRQELAEAKAFRFTSEVARDLPIPSDGLSRGWDFNEHGSYERVFKACSSSIHHGRGWDKTSSQQPRALFSSELLAFMALRRTLEKNYAKDLADIDRRIAELSA